MKLKRNLIYILSILFLSLLTAQFSHSVNIPANPGNHVVDLAGIIDNSTEAKLNQYLRELEQKTTAQIAILTIKSLEGESIEDLSITVAHDKWKLGQKGKDNGVLLLVSLKDRKYRIEVGYGLEGVIPDSLAGTIGRIYLVPFFKKGEYSNGIYTAALALANEIAKDSGVKRFRSKDNRDAAIGTHPSKDRRRPIYQSLRQDCVFYLFRNFNYPVYKKSKTLPYAFTFFIHGWKKWRLGRRRRFWRRWWLWWRRRRFRRRRCFRRLVALTIIFPITYHP